MAKGTSSGLLDEHRAQSIFKHTILATYVMPFAEMTGSRAPNRRVVVLDGFAGRGRYPDGSPGSAELILKASANARRAVIESILVEKKPSDFALLAEVVGEYRAAGVRAEALPGEVLRHLPTVLERAQAVPLFLFLDPCGANLPYNKLAAVLASDRQASWPATEALLNFSADLTRRAAGALKAGLKDHDALPVMDRTCGGPWWRQVALDAYASSPAGDFETAAFRVVAEYANRLGAASGMHVVTVPVRRRAHHQPVYHLVFLSRRTHGVWVFADAVARARQQWMRALGPAADDDVDALFSFADTVDQQIESEQRAAEQAVVRNLRAMLVSVGPIRLVDHVWAVYGDRYGVASESTVRKALRTLERAGELEVVGKAQQLRDFIVAAPRSFTP
ncbi:three-Cys-motif partner protein TcmP [Asanoa sp. WMMD1127]|uniref:three-Cys-motif partner protein TcmP n=1 Tax=Asanoa sp. WMMD1127 TaxID=3016107 RepID=UPI002415DCE0|nr:three-Cys-motif partner protein TcmP [Asanoa sp. WMMD1127]MDG4821782.1 three-Cys-motif partner protein TcmP [Asanoa sp. WMMD1127]